MDLTTVARAKVWIEADGDPVSSSSDTLLGRIVTTWSLAAEDMMNRVITTATTTQYFDVAPFQRVFSLSAFPVTAVSSVHNDASRDWDSGAIDSDNFDFVGSRGSLRVDYNLIPGNGVVRVIYTGGMAPSVATFATNFPDIADALDQQVAYAWQRRKSMGKETESDRMGNRTYTGAVGWLPHVKGVLETHRRITFGR